MKVISKTKIRIAMWTLLCMLTIPLSAHAVNGQILIGQTATTTFPIIISKPGSYVLASNLKVTTPGAIGILILANDVTLDLNGFAVIGDKSGGNDSRGIDARLRKNTTIKNGTVRNFFSDGVAVHQTAHSDPNDPGRNTIIQNLRVSDNGFTGIAADYCVIKDCVAADNGWYGIAVKSGTIINCETYRNGLGTDPYSSGIFAMDSTITNCTANYNKSFGIYAADSTIIGCTANHNQAIGIWSYIHGYQYRGASSIVNCTANLNSTGIRLDGKSRLEGCNVRDNDETGIFVLGEYSYLIKNVISGHGEKNLVVENPTMNYAPLTGENANMTW